MIDKQLDTPLGSPGMIRTFSGRLVDPFDLLPYQVIIKDIAHSLSQTCRFTGHTRRFYSVGEHCLMVASMLPTPRLKMAGLVHDASEAYFGDMAGPTKRRLEMSEYSNAEHRAAEMITAKYCGELSQRDREMVKHCDGVAYHIERKELMPPGAGEAYEIQDTDCKLGLSSPSQVETIYLQMFWTLSHQLPFNLKGS